MKKRAQTGQDPAFVVAAELQRIRKNLTRLQQLTASAIVQMNETDAFKGLPPIGLILGDIEEVANALRVSHIYMLGVALGAGGNPLTQKMSPEGRAYLRGMITDKAPDPKTVAKARKSR
jgi:hypothetical protein